MSPLIAESLVLRLCVAPSAPGFLISSRIRVTTRSVRKSCFDALGDRDSVLSNAALTKTGVFGSRSFASVIGL
jgi:hypothetical protein